MSHIYKNNVLLTYVSTRSVTMLICITCDGGAVMRVCSVTLYKRLLSLLILCNKPSFLCHARLDITCTSGCTRLLCAMCVQKLKIAVRALFCKEQ